MVSGPSNSTAAGQAGQSERSPGHVNNAAPRCRPTLLTHATGELLHAMISWARARAAPMQASIPAWSSLARSAGYSPLGHFRDSADMLLQHDPLSVLAASVPRGTALEVFVLIYFVLTVHCNTIVCTTLIHRICPINFSAANMCDKVLSYFTPTKRSTSPDKPSVRNGAAEVHSLSTMSPVQPSSPFHGFTTSAAQIQVRCHFLTRSL